MKIATYLIPLLAGAVLPLQALISARLAQQFGGPYWATLASFFTGTILLGVVLLLASSFPVRTVNELLSIPVWAWSAGLLGIVFVAGITISAPNIGAANTMALVVLSQMAFALILDHFGVLTQLRIAITWERAVGVILLIVGTWLVTRTQ